MTTVRHWMRICHFRPLMCPAATRTLMLWALFPTSRGYRRTSVLRLIHVFTRRIATRRAAHTRLLRQTQRQWLICEPMARWLDLSWIPMLSAAISDLAFLV